MTFCTSWFVRSVLNLVIAVCLWSGMAAGGHAQPAGKPQSLPKSPLAVESADGTIHHFTVEVAQTAAEQSTGMMYRTEVPDDTGMLFVYERPRRLSFWMKDTLVPLDMLFIKASGRISNIIAEAEPRTLTSRVSTTPGIAVLELRGGLAAELGIQPGDRVHHILLGSAPPARAAE